MRKVMMFIAVTVCTICTARADGTPAVMITVNSPTDAIQADTFTANITVRYIDTSLWNEETFIAYHVYDNDGNDVRFESERYKVILDGNGEATFDIPIDVAGLGQDEYIIVFDLIDNILPRWYSALEDHRNIKDMQPVVGGEYAQMSFKIGMNVIEENTQPGNEQNPPSTTEPQSPTLGLVVFNYVLLMIFIAPLIAFVVVAKRKNIVDKKENDNG